MASITQASDFQPWVENVAGLISDPVKRLRFLRTVAPLAHGAREPRRRHWRRLAWALLLLAGVAAVLLSISLTRKDREAPVILAVRPAAPIPLVDRPSSDVWRVEERGNFEVYSNGLRIDNTFAVSDRSRSYLAFPSDRDGPAVQRSEPAGIVFHSTESHQAPFEAAHNDDLKKIGESLLESLRRRRSYHFLIDRFGRVYRVVVDTGAARHAGHSVWADAQWVYVNLNESFLGVAFEARTGGQSGPEVTAAQTRSGAMLTEMLRARYHIPASACVTHAQVSVNPSNMRVGYHVDWAAAFPFQELGLPDNYAIALPSIWTSGFEADEVFRNAAGGKMQAGIELAARLFQDGAAAAGLRPLEHRKQLQQVYRRRLAAVRGFAGGGG